MKFFFVFFICFVINWIDCSHNITIDSHEYFVSNPLKKNWFMALKHCAAMDMYLIDIPTVNEEFRIFSLLFRQEFKKYPIEIDYWTSGTDQGSKGNFYWATSGRDVTHSSWDHSKLDRYRLQNQNCVVLQTANEFMWDDRSCNDAHYFVCRNSSNPENEEKCSDDLKSLYSNMIL